MRLNKPWQVETSLQYLISRAWSTVSLNRRAVFCLCCLFRSTSGSKRSFAPVSPRSIQYSPMWEKFLVYYGGLTSYSRCENINSPIPTIEVRALFHYSRSINYVFPPPNSETNGCVGSVCEHLWPSAMASRWHEDTCLGSVRIYPIQWWPTHGLYYCQSSSSLSNKSLVSWPAICVPGMFLFCDSDAANVQIVAPYSWHRAI